MSTKPKAGKGGKASKAVQQQQQQQQQQEEDDNVSQQSWEEYCYECQDGGNVMCCESCPQVAHYKCVGLKVAPKGEWWCKDCTAKKAAAQKKQTNSRIVQSSNMAKMSNGRGGSSGGAR